MARKFLYVVAVLIGLVIAGFFLLRFFAQDLTEMAFVPSAPFTDQPRLADKSYDDPAMWLARPGQEKSVAYWLPAGFTEAEPGRKIDAAVFFVHPTGMITRDAWNAALDDEASNARSRLFVQGMASPFNASTALWVPRYRQAAVGAFLTDAPEAARALDLAYRDVEQAFATFLKAVKPGQPIVLAGHSQGAFHLRRLIRDHVAGTPLAERIVAAYVIGWPVSVEHDLPLMKMPACQEATSTGCVVSWMTFADPADAEMLVQAYARRRGLDGQELGTGGAFVCVDPISGRQDGTGEAKDNLGTLVPDLAAGTGTLVPGVVPSQCGPDHLLHIGAPPKLDMGPYALPGNNYHLYDVTLFWANLRADFARRVAAFEERAR
jgi:Protein of unknown function (DUF3089)